MMAHKFHYERDRYYFPIEVDASTNQIVVDEQDGQGDKIVTITPRERYYAHEDDSQDGSIGYALLHEIKTAMTAQLTGTYEFATTIADGSKLPGGAIRFFRQDAGNFSFNFGSADWTFDQRILGFKDSTTGVSGLLDNEKSPVSIWGEWISYNEVDGAASDKRAEPDRHTASSSDRASAAATRRYYADTLRPIEYQWVPGAHVRANRAKDGASADTAGLPVGDVHNAIEGMFDLFTAPTSDAEIPKVVIVHDSGAALSHENVYGPEPYEVAQLAPVDDQLSRPDALWDLQRMAGEYYTIRWVWDIQYGTYDQ